MKIKKNLLMKMIKMNLVNLPTPSNISLWWNMGSLLGMCLMIQLISGLFLAMHYVSNIDLAFNSVMNIYYNVNYGWLMKILHTNSASLMFICMYMHISRGMYYSSFYYSLTWTTGIIILILTMMTAFMGYMLPWSQMSFWGATVITNLLSVIPYMGNFIVMWIWGGFSINNATLMRFFSIHFLLPFIMMSMIVIHLIFLHKTGSNNPLGINSNIDMVSFYPYFSIKDLFGFLLTLTMLMMFMLMYPNLLSDPDNFIKANPMITPIHIQPEWYFLFAYAILRSIPNKLGGVVALFLSIMVFFTMPIFNKKIQSNSFYPINKLILWVMLMILVLLTWIGMRPVEEPYIYIGQFLTINYFLSFLMLFMASMIWDKILFKK